jgi:hypothetical protein
MRTTLSMNEQDGPDCYEKTALPLVEFNRWLNGHIEQRDELARLCGEMIATLSIERNGEEPISKLKSILEGWVVRYRKYSGEVGC